MESNWQNGWQNNANESNPADADGVHVQHTGAVRFHKPPFLESTLDIISCTRAMEPLHRTKVIAIKASFNREGYITKTEFDSLSAIFTRYKPTLTELHAGGEDGMAWLIEFQKQLVWAEQLAAIAKSRIDEAAKRRGDTGNFEWRQRVPQAQQERKTV